MKRILLTIIISFIAIFYTGCEALEEAIKSQSGCMLPDATNYNESAIFACTDITGDCLEGKTGSNCCCEDITYGCKDPTKYDYNASATAACDNSSHGCGSENCCCTDVVSGCMNSSATNYNALANTDDGNCTYKSTSDGSTYGCTDSDACNYVLLATLDCNQIAIAGVALADQNTKCCSSPSNTTCYLDSDNDGFPEDTRTMPSAVCNCATDPSLGPGWKNENQVSKEKAVMGCTNPFCPEYDAEANVDNGGCCTTDESAYDTSNVMYSLLGTYEVDLTYGWIDDNGTCVADADDGYDDFGPDSDIMTLGFGGEFKHEMAFIHAMQGFEIWEYQPDPSESYDIYTMDGCEQASYDANSEYFMCLNYFSGEDDNNQGCWEIGNGTECQNRPDCHWETRFCHYNFAEQGIPCAEFYNEDDCYANNCEWGYDGMSYQCRPWPVDPWEECSWLDDDECNDDANCELVQSSGEEQDLPWCLSDCPSFEDLKECGNSTDCKCIFIDDINTNDDYWCLADCDEEVMMKFGEFAYACEYCSDEDIIEYIYNNDVNACFADYVPDGGGGNDETWTECMPKNQECFDFTVQAMCSSETDDFDCKWEMPPQGGPGHCVINITQAGCNTHLTAAECLGDTDCEWGYGPDGSDLCLPAMGGVVHCEEFGTEDECWDEPECSWDFPWELEGQDGMCDQIDLCAHHHKETECNFDPNNDCQWEDGYGGEPPGCFMTMNNAYCDCALEIQDASSCAAAGGTWKKPDWADTWEDIYLCMDEMTESMCYQMEEYEENNPCAEDLEAQGFNQDIDWVSSTSSCNITFTESEAGTWGLSTDGTKLCIEFEEKSEEVFNCADQQTEEECYCGDCNWISGGWGQPDRCENNMGRVVKKERVQYNTVLNRMITECGSAGNPGMSFTVDSAGNIIIYIEDEDEGWCDEIKLTQI